MELVLNGINSVVLESKKLVAKMNLGMDYQDGARLQWKMACNNKSKIWGFIKDLAVKTRLGLMLLQLELRNKLQIQFSEMRTASREFHF
ncbi:hypothetical protein C5167_006561 [Papaver somniferum]|uniref:Uncharacterized protein n=1 Tax=Papaver somniferum TaxID=3469 RepID=A0A4Y7JH54_PAPSO|nr:hypothetical protein C5167_006561 [Papaver somniferum]